MSTDQIPAPLTVAPLNTAHDNDPMSKRIQDSHTFRAYPAEVSPEGHRIDAHGYQSDPYLHCSYCGSLTVDDALAVFSAAGVRWSASDYKYGWPHKFYLDVPHASFMARIGSSTRDGVTTPIMGEHKTWPLKFYTVHLIDATDAQLAQWNAVVAPITGVSFMRDPNDKRGIHWRAEAGAAGRFGTIA